MNILRYLRTCCYWMLLFFGTVFLVLSMFMTKNIEKTYTTLHFATLYGSLLCLLLTTSLSVTLLTNPHPEDNHLPGTTWMTLGASLLVSSMIAAFLFFV